MLKIKFTAKFKRDYALAVRRGLDLDLLQEVISLLREEKPLLPSYRDHALTNSRDYKNMRECHIQNDWLLVYQVLKDQLILRLIRTGTHSDLFRK